MWCAVQSILATCAGVHLQCLKKRFSSLGQVTAFRRCGCRVVACYIVANSESYRTRGDQEADLFWRLDIVGESCDGVGAGSNVEILHPSELIPSLADVVLAVFDVSPFQGDG